MAFVGLLLFSLVSPFLINGVAAQDEANYYVTVKPLIPIDSLLYTTVGQNWTVSFEALWSYGDNSGKPIKNATATLEVSNSKGKHVDTLSFNTTEGVFAFNYTSLTADKLTLTPTKLVTEEGKEWNPDLMETENSLYGLYSTPLVVWYDTFHVDIANVDTSVQGYAAVTVNVTYFLLSEEGLNLPAWATYSNQTFLPKTVQDATVTINGVKAQESQEPGVYFANVPIWLPTTYVHVAVSQEGWVTTRSGFSFAHQTNEPIWLYAVALGSLFSIGALLVAGFVFRKAGNPLLFKRQNFPSLGAILLAAASLVGFYWGLVGLDCTLHGFDWIFLAMLSLFSFGIGLVGCFMAVRKNNQALVISAVLVVMLSNMVGVQFSLGMYQLVYPWLVLIISFVLSLVSGVLISNADENFS